MSNHIEIIENLPTYVDPYPGKDDSEVIFVDCHRCFGQGYFVGFEHIAGGVCFECGGHKGHDSTVGTLRKQEKGRITRDRASLRKTLKKQRFHNEQMEKAEAAFPVLAGWFEAISENNFMMDLWTKAFDHELSDKQIAAAAKTLQSDIDYKAKRAADKAAEEAAATPVVEGKGTITGTILTVKYQESQYGGSWKMLVKDDRCFKVWGTAPAALFDQQEAEAPEGTNPFTEHLKGRKVTFTATVEASADDKSFGFFKRPTKLTLLPAE